MDKRVLLGALTLFAGCSPPTPGPAPTPIATVAPVPVQPASPKPVPVLSVPAREIGRDQFAVIVSGDQGAIERALRAPCDGRQFCKAFAWTSADTAASAMPMTDRELAAEVATYSLNRDSGLDEVLWDCGRYPQADKAKCMAK